MKKFLLCSMILVVFLFAAACASEEQEPEELELTILVRQSNVSFMRHMANRFNDYTGLDVDFTFETYFDWAASIQDIQTLILEISTTNEIDIFINSSAGINSRSQQFLSSFVDLNELIDGENGINRQNYFDHIFRASEIDGNLYAIPLLISPAEPLLVFNRYYADAVGVNLGAYKITTDEMLDFWVQASELYPDRNLFLNVPFNLGRVLTPRNIVDMRNQEVNVPTDIEKIELAMSIPSVHIFYPDTIRNTVWITSDDFAGSQDLVPSAFYNPFHHRAVARQFLFEHLDFPLHNPWVSVLQDIENIQVGPKMLNPNNNERVPFNVSLSLSILEQSQQQDLAWDFIRFVLEAPVYIPEYDDPNPFSNASITRFLDNNIDSAILIRNFHTNQNIFDDFAGNLLRQSAIQISNTQVAEFLADISFSDAEIEQIVQNGLQRYQNIMQMLNYSSYFVNIWHITSEQLYLVSNGFQSIEETLLNLQNALEIFVAEQGGF